MCKALKRPTIRGLVAVTEIRSNRRYWRRGIKSVLRREPIAFSASPRVSLAFSAGEPDGQSGYSAGREHSGRVDDALLNNTTGNYNTANGALCALRAAPTGELRYGQ